MFDHFVGLALKGLRLNLISNTLQLANSLFHSEIHSSKLQRKEEGESYPVWKHLPRKKISRKNQTTDTENKSLD